MRARRRRLGSVWTVQRSECMRFARRGQTDWVVGWLVGLLTGLAAHSRCFSFDPFSFLALNEIQTRYPGSRQTPLIVVDVFHLSPLARVVEFFSTAARTGVAAACEPGLLRRDTCFGSGVASCIRRSGNFARMCLRAKECVTRIRKKKK